MSNHSTSVYNSTEERAIALLGANHSIDTVASATGVSASRISQLMSQEGFKEKVLSLRVKSLQENNARDAKYDQLEDKVLDKIADMLPLVHRPMELSKLLQTFNNAKRRGAAAPTESTAAAAVVSITLPSVIVNTFTTNIHNQVISAGIQELVTVQSSAMAGMVAAKKDREKAVLVLEDSVRKE